MTCVSGEALRGHIAQLEKTVETQKKQLGESFNTPQIENLV